MTPGPSHTIKWVGHGSSSTLAKGLFVLKDKAPDSLHPRLLPGKTFGHLEMSQETICLPEHLSHQPLGNPTISLPRLQALLLHHFHPDWVDIFIYPLKDIYQIESHNCHWIVLFTFTSRTVLRL